MSDEKEYDIFPKEGVEVTVAWKGKAFTGIVKGYAQQTTDKQMIALVEPTGKVPRRLRKLCEEAAEGYVPVSVAFLYTSLEPDATCPRCEKNEVNDDDYLCEECR